MDIPQSLCDPIHLLADTAAEHADPVDILMEMEETVLEEILGVIHADPDNVDYDVVRAKVKRLLANR